MESYTRRLTQPGDIAFQLLCCCLALWFVLSPISADASTSEITLQDERNLAAKIKGFMDQKKMEYAKLVIDKHLEIKPDSPPIKRELARYYLRNNRIYSPPPIEFSYEDDIAEKITELLNDVVGATPNDSQAWSMLVRIHAIRGNVGAGKSALRQALQQTEQSKGLFYNRALLAIRDNRLADAARFLAPYTRTDVFKAKKISHDTATGAWSLLKQIALLDPSLDPLRSVREGLVTRIDIKDVANTLETADSTSKPIIMMIGSQDENCGPCKADLPNLQEFAQASKDAGELYTIFYASVEPWRNLSKQTILRKALNIKGVPFYNMVYKNHTVYAVPGKTDKMPLINRYDELLRKAKFTHPIRPFSDFVFSAVHDGFKQYKDHDDDYKAMAYFLDGQHWNYFRTYGHSSQEEANKAAMEGCGSQMRYLNLSNSCVHYAAGGKLVDTETIERQRKSRDKRIKEKKEAQKKKKALAAKKKKNKAKKSGSAQGAINLFMRKANPFQALALAQNGSEFVTGEAINAITQSDANKLAIQACENAKLEIDIDEPCEVAVIGKKAVEDNSEAAIKKLMFSQQKKMAKKSPIKGSYLKYRKFSSDRAYAISSNGDDEWAYGMAFGKRSKDDAQAEALAECETARSEKGLSTPCRILLINGKFVD